MILKLLEALPEEDRFFCNEDQIGDRIFELFVDAPTTNALIQNMLANNKQYWDCRDLRDFVLALIS